jgi:hypothetical protein
LPPSLLFAGIAICAGNRRFVMSLIDLNRDAARGFGKGGAAMLPRAVRRVRAVFRRIHAAIAAARLHRLREEAERQPRMPLLLGDKWDF